MSEELAYIEAERAYLADRRRYMPWLRKGPLDERERIHHEVLRKHAGANIHPDAYVSPGASVFTGRFAIGARSWIASGAIVRGHVAIGDDSTVNAFAHIAGRVRIGSGVRIASQAALFGFNHGFSRVDVPIYLQPQTSDGIVVEDGVWIGVGAVVTDGCTVGAHTIVAAGAIVTKSFGDHLIVGGNPARILRDRREGQMPAGDQ